MDIVATEQDVPLLLCGNDNTDRKEIYTENFGYINDTSVETLNELEEDLIGDLNQRIPKLPKGIDRYFFVSHSSEDSDRVFSYVQVLESRFNLSCVYADRDFQPGKDISENIKEGMARSLKVLLFLSHGFQQSGWCKFERDFAFINSIENGSSCVIPIKLEECDIPTTLKTLTYIDATCPNADADVPAKIVSALVETYEADGFLPVDFGSSLRKYESGYSFNIFAEREVTWCPCSPAKYQFQVDSELFRVLKSNKVELPERLVMDTIAMVNDASVMWSYDYLKRCNIFIWSLMSIPFFLALFVFIEMTKELKYASRTRFNYEDLNTLETSQSIDLALGFPLTASLFGLLSILIVPILCHRRERDVRLQQKLWQSFGDQFISTNALIIFSGRKNKRPALHFMRYNFAKCTEHLTGVIMTKYPEMESNIAEALATSHIKGYILGIISVLADDFDSLPDAPFNRHNVKKGKMCMCQYLEPIILRPDVNV